MRRQNQQWLQRQKQRPLGPNICHQHQEDGGEANPDRVETDDHFNPAQEDLDLFDEEDILAEYEGDIHQQKWIRYQQNSKL
jgi:hypothetical protein